MKYKFRLTEANAKEAEIGPENVEGVTLLSLAAISKFPTKVVRYDWQWWTRSPGGYQPQKIAVARTDGRSNYWSDSSVNLTES